MQSRAHNLEGDEQISFARRERARIEQTWSGRSEESDDERTHQPLDHQAQVRVARIEVDRVPDKQRPEHDTDRTKQQADWKKNPERFAGRQLEKILPDRDRHKIDN